MIVVRSRYLSSAMSRMYLAGHEADGSRAFDKVGCAMRCLTADWPRILATKHTSLVSGLPPYRVRDWRHREPQPFPRHPRNHAQPRVQERQS